MNFDDWPMNSPSWTNPLIASVALISIGRITAQGGRAGLMNSHGTGKIRLVWTRGLTVSSKFGNVNPLVGSVTGATGGCTLLPEKSTHSRK
jgi:hypothetical protein